LIDSTGAEKATLANPVRTDPVGTTTQPVSCVSGCIGGGGANAAASATGSAVPAAADYSGVNIGGNLVGQTGRSVGTARAADVALNDSSGNQIGLAAAPLRIDPVGTTTQPVSAASLPLPANAAQETGGNLATLAGAITAGVMSVKQTGPVPGVTTAQTGAAASSLVAKASAGSVVSISGSAVSGSFIMIFNATSAPADGAVTPLKCWGPMAAAGPFAFGWGPGPVLTMSTGITVVSSSTGCFTKTATNAAFIAVEYQ
jgi:hypothetical protein